MKRRELGPLVGMIALGMVSCGGSSSPESADKDVTALVQANCQQIFRCCKSASDLAAISNGMWTTEAGCESYVGLGDEGSRYEADLAIKQGLLTVNDSAVQGCVTALAMESCATFSTASSAPSQCDPTLLYTGNVATGGQCFLDAECVKGDHCAMPSAGLTQGGVCVPFQESGQPCSADSDCDPILYCNGKSWVCAKYGEVGDKCMYAGTPTVGGTQTVRCDPAKTDCDTTLLTCQPYATAGSSCQTIQCDPDPSLGLTCDSLTEKCKAPMQGTVGTPCISDSDCQSTLYCAYSSTSCTYSCQMRDALGAACDASSASSCVANAYCAYDSVSGTYVCAARHPAGSACSASTECQAGLYCPTTGSTPACTMEKTNGTTCADGSECLSGNCDFTKTPSVCAPQAGAPICTGM